MTLQYALSSEGIKKICKQFEIPMPDGGYWSKHKFNKKVSKTKFNQIFRGVDKIVFTIREEGNPVNVDQTPLTIRTKEIENDTNAPLIVPDEITNPDILTIQTKQYKKGKLSFASYREDFCLSKTKHLIGIYLKWKMFPPLPTFRQCSGK